MKFSPPPAGYSPTWLTEALLKSTPMPPVPAPDGLIIPTAAPDITLSLSAWNKLSEKAQWDIKAALRGPDVVNSDGIKHWSTAVIRYACRKCFRVGGAVNSELPLIVWPKLLHDDEHMPSTPLSFDSSHFFQHIREAASYLEIPNLGINYDDWAKAVGGKGDSTHGFNIGPVLLNKKDFPPQWRPWARARLVKYAQYAAQTAGIKPNLGWAKDGE